MREAEVTVWTAAELKLDEEWLGLKGSPTTVAGVGMARGADRRREFLEGTPEEKARQLLDRIRPWLRVA